MKSIAALALLAAVPAIAQAPAQPTIDLTTMHVQVILSKLGFSPGVLDGKGGESLNDALRGFQQSRGLAVSGKLDRATLGRLHAFRAWRPVRQITLDAGLLAGPFTNPIPADEKAKAALPALDYRNAVEALAERFHTTPATLVALNGGGTRIAAGARLTVPNALPTSRDYSVTDEAARARLNALNVEANVPVAARVVVDKSDRVLRVFDAQDRLVAQFPATMGSSRDPLPIGKWTIKGVSYNPTWTYNPAILKTADKSDPVLTIPAGPNNPVGVMWIDLSKEHYGIHGTSEPSQIGRAESNGCIRLTNWDVLRLALMVKAGVPAVFQP